MSIYGIPDLVVHEQVPIAKYTAARLGGVADYLAVAHHPQALAAAVKWARIERKKWLILGGGANVLISDAGLRGLVIINRCRKLAINRESGTVSAESGVSLSTLARRTMSAGLKGFAWGVSVPGTVGGAVVNNAGAHGADMARDLVNTTLIDLQAGEQPQTWSVDQLEYDYRHSALKGQSQRFIVLSAILQLAPGHDSVTLNHEANEFIAYRKRTQPPGASLGSMFKNPPDDYAGRLIEEAGLKGYRIGGVSVSAVHANFFVNDDNATAADYNALIRHVQQTVLDEFGITLELEVERLGEGFPS